MYTPAPYQQLAVDKTIAYIRNGGKAGLISMATGLGKSIVISNIAHRLFKANDINIMVATHAEDLVEQDAKKLIAIDEFLDIGIYSAGLGLKQFGHRITFAGIQSAYRVDWGKIHLLIIDEAHLVSRNDGSMYHKLINNLKAKNPNLVIIGLSATTFRLDSGNLTSGDDAIFKDIIFEYGMKEGVRDGYLVPLTGKHTRTEYDFSKVGKLAGEYNLKELEAVTNIDRLTQSAIQELLGVVKTYNRRCIMIYANGVKHSFAICEEIRKYGFDCEVVTGETPKDVKRDILERYKSGELPYVVNFGVWTTGLDVPIIDVIAMFRKTMSGGLLVQMGGRGTRPTVNVYALATAKERRELIRNSSKPDCLFLDFASNIEEHGFIDQIKGKDKKEKGSDDNLPPMKFCTQCSSICYASARKCPDCGFEFPINTMPKISGLYDGAVMSGEYEGEWLDVYDVEYIAHNIDHKSKKPCLRVKYTLDDSSSISDYVFLMHTGYAYDKAIEWWNGMGGEDISNLSIPMIVKYKCPLLNKPTRILVKKEGKFDKVKSYDFEPVALNSLSANDDSNTDVEYFDIPF